MLPPLHLRSLSTFRSLVSTLNLPPPPPTSSVTYSTYQNLATITITAPSTRNALSPHMMLQLEDCINLAKANNPPFLVLTGAHNAFCSGADITVAAATLMPADQSAEGGRAMATHMNHCTALLKALPNTISFAAIDGAAYGGGAELATSCDFRVVTPTSELRFVQTKMGVTTGWGGGRRLVEIVGRRKALELLAFSDVVTAKDGVRIGLFDFVSDEGDTAAEFVSKKVAGVELPNWKAVVDADDASEEIEEFCKVWNQDKHRREFEKAMQPRK